MGIVRPATLARELAAAGDDAQVRTALTEMDDKTAARLARQAKELDDLRKALERSREKVGVDSEELRRVVGTAF